MMNNSLFIRGLSLKNSPGAALYISGLPAVAYLKRELVFSAPVVFFAGENGSGKSTLLEAAALACRFNAEGGSKNFNFITSATHSALHEYLRVRRGVRRESDGFFLRAESFYNVATNIDELTDTDLRLYDLYGGKSLHQHSHGESFLALAQNRFKGEGLYLLDEPEAALSQTGQFALLARIHELVNQNSQFIIATHSPILLAYPGAEIFVFDETGITKTPYRQTQAYQLTKSFINNPDGILKHLFKQ